MTIDIRPAKPEDAPQMCALLNAIIEKGGTTAHRRAYDEARMLANYICNPYGVSCFVADKAGAILGFQSLERDNPDYPVPDRWGVIATFVKVGTQGRGIGQRLFAATQASAHAARLIAIDATIRAENEGGLAYYGKMGFVDHHVGDRSISKKFTLTETAKQPV